MVRVHTSPRPAVRLALLLATLALAAVAAPRAALAACGPIPAEYAVYARSALRVDGNVRVNGHGVGSYTSSWYTAVELDGDRRHDPQALPSLDAFPANGSSLDVTHTSSPFVATGEVYYDDIRLGPNSSATFSGGGTFHMDRLEADDGATITFGAGTYYIDNLLLEDDVRIVVADGPVVLHVGSEVVIDDDAEINKGGDPADLQVLLHGGADFEADDRLEMAGVIYGPGFSYVDLGAYAKFDGLLASRGQVRLRYGTRWTLSTDDQAAIAAISTCTAAPEPVLVAWYGMEEAQWTGSGGEVADDNGLHDATAENGADTAVASPALPGNPGTCRYGEFDGVDDHLRLPSSFPNLTGSFTVTAWIRADTIGGDNRILADDAGNSGGYAFSLGDAGNTGRLRFFNRNVSPVSVDTQSVVVTAGTWYFVAAVHDAAAKTRRIYVDGVAQTLDNGATVATYTGTWGTDSGRASIGGEVDGSGEATSQFRFDGDIDEVRVYTGAMSQAAIQVVMAATRPCDLGADHFAVSHDGGAVTCAVEPVTVRAHQSDHSVVTDYTGTIALTTSTAHGDWSLVAGSGTLVNAGNGAASYTFAPADNGSVTLGLANTFTETVNVDVNDGSTGEDPAEDADLVFAETGFRFLAGGVPNALGTQIAGKPGNVAPGAQVVELEAIRTDTATGACEAALAGSVAVEMALECVDTATCGVATASVNGVAVTANDAGAVAGWTGVALDFGDASDGTATVVLRHDDAGSVRWHARRALADAGGGATGNVMQGASNTHVWRPFAFEIDFSGDRAANGTAGASYAADAGGSVFARAGESFAAELRAVLWQAADDGDADGIADPGADLGGNATAVSFLREATPAAVSFTHALVAPAAGDPGTLTGGLQTPYGAGTANAALAFDEVGIIDVSATSADYLGGGQAVTGTVANVGRFHPARLDWSDDGPSFRDGPDAGWTCGFTWMEQPFTFASSPVFTVTARNTAGGVTANYGGAFFKLGTPTLSGRSYASTATSAAALDAPGLGTVVLDGEDDFDGVATLTLDDEQLAYTRGSAPEAPFTAEVTLTLAAVDLTDADGVCFHDDGSDCVTADGDTGDPLVVGGIDGASLRFGRLALVNGSGSELMPVALPARTELFDGTGFTIATDDTCTRLPSAALDLANDAADPVAGVASIAVGAATTTATIANDPLLAGDAGLTLSAPGAGNTGHVDVVIDLSLAAAPWLRFDWDGDGAHDDDPLARATFGILSGSPFLINVREPWN